MGSAVTGRGAPGHRSTSGRARAAGIYGTIVTAAVLATAGGRMAVAPLCLLVFFTLVVYWMAELYAEVLGEHVHAGRLPQGRELRILLGSSWQMVTASYLPLAALVLSAVLGLDPLVASYLALAVTLVLLVVHGRSAARAAGLTGARLLAATGVAALLGLSMVALKAFITH